MGTPFFPTTRPGITKEEMTWNELFYYCLQKNYWIFSAGILFIGLFIYVIITGMFGKNLFAVLVLIIIALGVVYICVALPVSFIYATVISSRNKKNLKNA